MSASTQVALLRGINVGGHAKVAMADLRSLVADLGFGDVRTHLNSGNVVFTNNSCGPDEAASQIGEAMARRLGVEVAVLARAGEDLAGVVAANPLGSVATDPSRYFVAFFSGPPKGVIPDVEVPDRLVLLGREGYLWCPNGARDTPLTNAFLEKRLGVVSTSRNWNTVTRLLALTQDGD